MKLIKYSDITEEEYEKYIIEWEKTGEQIVPYASRRIHPSFKITVETWQSYESEEMYEAGKVPSTLYFMVNDTRVIVGAVDFRHTLNSKLKQVGGHVGYGIKPSMRGKGYGTILLKLILQIIKEKEYSRVLISCDETNIKSAKIIEANGGILENKVTQGSNTYRRYWISLE